jgi:hypothetical protein
MRRWRHIEPAARTLLQLEEPAPETLPQITAATVPMPTRRRVLSVPSGLHGTLTVRSTSPWVTTHNANLRALAARRVEADFLDRVRRRAWR